MFSVWQSVRISVAVLISLKREFLLSDMDIDEVIQLF
jgi:hypothetical protein